MADWGDKASVIASTLLVLTLVERGAAFAIEHNAASSKQQAHSGAELISCWLYHVFIVSTLGRLWLFPPPELLRDPLYGFDEQVQVLLLCACGMELWSFGFELYKKYTLHINSSMCLAMLAHHATAGYLGWLGTAPFLHRYGCFYFGITSISNVFLCMHSFFETFPALQARYPTAHQVCRALFAIAFLLVRGVWWFLVTPSWWVIMVELLWEERCHSQSAVLVFLASNAFLSALQLKWGLEICSAALAAPPSKPNWP